MESLPASECLAADRRVNVRDSIRDDIRLDGEWKHQRLCEGASRCEPVGTGKLFVQIFVVFASSSLTSGQLA